MSSGGIADSRAGPQVAIRPAGNPPHGAGVQRIPGAFQLGLALYIILTGELPTIVQAIVYGLPGGGGGAFATAMVTGVARDLLLLLPVLLLASHPLGILHPLILAVVLWPLVIGMPKVIDELGGWTGVFSGLPVDTPVYKGLLTHDPTRIWIANAKYNGLLILSLLSTYLGFWLLKFRGSEARAGSLPTNTVALRSVMLALFAASLVGLFVFLYLRGGLVEHLTALGRGRFRELQDDGVFIVVGDLAAIALYVWVAARPGDAKSLMFLAALFLATFSQFAANGSRGQALAVPLVVGLIWALRQQKVPWKIAAILVPLMFASVGFLGAIRTAQWSDETASQAFLTTGWHEALELSQREIAARRAASANIPIMERSGQVTGPLLGSTYVAAITAFVPRVFWPDKPRTAGSLYAQKFLGDPKNGGGIPVAATVEMYWNFGLGGVVLLSLLYGALIRFVFLFMWRRYPDPFRIVFYVLFVTGFQFGSRSLVMFEQQLCLLYFCYATGRFFSATRNVVSIGAPPNLGKLAELPNR